MITIPDYSKTYFQLLNGKEVTEKYLIYPLKPIPIKDVFFVNIDYEKVKKEVEKISDFLKMVFGNKLVKVEHVGSTSIKNMPGTAISDLIVYVDPFPPSNRSLAILDSSGFKFRGIAPHSYTKEDLFFVRQPEHPILKDDYSNFAFHIVPKHSTELDSLIKFRDIANSDPIVHDEYKKVKLQAYNSPNIRTFFEYKRDKTINARPMWRKIL